MPQTIDNSTTQPQNPPTQPLENRLPEVFNIDHSSDRICQNWLTARHQRSLNSEETQHYDRIVLLLEEVGQLMDEIKTVFQTKIQT
jgi:hypothetical protein